MGEPLVFNQALKIFGLLQVQVEKFERLHVDKHHTVFLVKQSKLHKFQPYNSIKLKPPISILTILFFVYFIG
jgi:hypothetical protein